MEDNKEESSSIDEFAKEISFQINQIFFYEGIMDDIGKEETIIIYFVFTNPFYIALHCIPESKLGRHIKSKITVGEEFRVAHNQVKLSHVPHPSGSTVPFTMNFNYLNYIIKSRPLLNP